MDFYSRRQSGAASLLTSMLALSIPLLLGGSWIVYYISPEIAILILRPTVFAASILLALFNTRAQFTQAERRLALIFGIFCAALLVPSIAATDPARAFTDLSKVALMCGWSLLWCRTLRRKDIAPVLGPALIASACCLAVLILYAYVHFMGFAIPTYKSSREFKGIAEKVLPLNAVAFASVFSYILGMLFVQTRKSLLLLGGVLIVVSSVFTGSRAPLAVIALSSLLVLLFKAFRSRRLLFRTCAWLAVATVAIAVPLVFGLVPFKEMSKVTEGRWDLWSVAIQKFVERPIFGYGFESWRDDLVSRLPGEYSLTLQLARTIAGGYHNEYLTMLAEQGLVGFIPTMCLFGFILRSSWKLAFYSWHTWTRGAWALFGCILLFARASVEMPGLFGYCQEPADYLAYLFVAIVVSRFSVEEEYVRRREPPIRHQAMPLIA